MKKRILTVLLAVCLVLALGTVTALADGTSAESPITINGVGYANMYQAVNAAKSGDTIVLNDDVEVSVLNIYTDDIYKPVFGGKFYPLLTLRTDVTIDLNGNNISIASADKSKTFICDLALFGIKGSTADVKVIGEGTIDSAAGNNTVYGFDVTSGGKLTIDGPTVTGAPTAVQVSNGDLIIYDGTFKLADTVTGDDIAEYSKYIINAIDGTVANKTSEIAIYGGTFGYDYSEPTEQGAEAFIPAGVTTSNENGNTVVTAAKEPTDGSVAEVNGIYFDSLSKAIGAALSGDTITLLKDISLNNNIVISKDVTITGTSKDITITAYENQTNENYRITVQNGANLVLKDLAVEASYGADIAAPIVSVKDTAKLTIDGCTISDVSTSGYSTGYGLINTMGTTGSKVTITNSTVNSKIGTNSGVTFYVLGGGGNCELDVHDNVFNLGSWFMFNINATGKVYNNVFNGNGENSSGRIINATNLAGLVVDNNTFAESLSGTQFVIGGDFTISNNVFEPLADDLAIGIYNKPTTQSSISGNTFYLDEDSYGIRILNAWGGVAGSLENLKIEDNKFIGSGVYQIRNDSWTGTADLSTNDFGDEVAIYVGNGATLTMKLPDAPTRDGYTFVGWKCDGQLYKAGATVEVSSNMTFTAVWTAVNIPDPNPIKIVDTANGSVDTSLSNASVGSVITITATPDAGYTVGSVVVTGPDGIVEVKRVDATTYTFKMPDGSVKVNVTFVKGLPFTDVTAGQWFYEAVSYVYANGMMQGDSATTFSPNAQMTRAMFWAVLGRIDGAVITGTDWVAEAREWAMAEGVSDGTDPNGIVTREQMVTMLWRYAGEPASNESLAAYIDADSVSTWAETAMRWAIENGIIEGMTATTLVPQGTATRAQCAAIFMRYANI